MSGDRQFDVVVIGGGHNGLVCAAYVARAGLSVAVLEQSDTPGGCCYTVDLPDGRGRLELGSYEHGGIRGSGVSADLELESRFGLGFHLRDEVTLAPCDDGTALGFDASLEKTIDNIGPIVGPSEAEAYRRFAGWASSAMQLIHQTESGPAPTMRQLSSLAELALGSEAEKLLQTIFGSASALLRGTFEDERLQGPMAHWAGHSQQSPLDPGTGGGVLMMAGGHGHPSARPVGGSRSTIEALVRCLEGHGGVLQCGAAVERVELQGGRAVAVHAGGERWGASRAVISAIDVRRLFGGLMRPDEVPARLRDELRRVHVGRRNVSEIKVDAQLASMPEIPGPAGFERSFMLSANTTTDIEQAFARVQLGELPERPPVMIAFPSVLEPGWAPEGRATVWLSTFVPWAPADGPWDQAKLETAADLVWKTAERALGTTLDPVEKRITGPNEWVARHGNGSANPNQIEMSMDQLLSFRPTPSLARYATPIGGLYLTGAGTHPGGGVTGMPGRNAANVVLQDLGLAPKRPTGQRVREQIGMVRDAAKAALAMRKNV